MNNLKIDISLLPTNAQNELYDFYEFLMYKYTNRRETTKINVEDIIPRKIEPFEPLNRKDIYER
ncbi:MAG: hypothetical protein KDK90_28640 [Leptospiraceae bacterium]|nr:hypothetical protein [Leptospiraceae bacterium]